MLRDGVLAFISASLLFFVQPMYAKLVLPLLGGAPAVWTTAMLFFQTALLAGYAYAHLVSTRLPGRLQLGLHAAVWACGLAFLPIAVPTGWAYDVAATPIGQTLAIFGAGVGVPFFALAANAPLLQKWYASSGGQSASDPYHLYAASNAGSLIAAASVALALSLAPEDDAVLFTAIAVGAFLLLFARAAPLRFALTTAGLFLAGHAIYSDAGVIHRARSFFGVYTVRDDTATGIRTLGHGTTQHGLEFIGDLGTRPRILSYYHPDGPLGQIFLSGAAGPEARVGIVGLGVGALACYARPGQRWRFYEIDALIDDIARNPSLFSYLSRCAGDAPTVLGDARVTLAGEADERFDVLVIDAYSSNAIPVHLITLEALGLYFSRLAPGGLLAFHISNRYYRLAPVLGDAAQALGAAGFEQFHTGIPDRPLEPGESEAHVVVLARDAEPLSRFAGDPRWHRLEPGGGAAWTDDHANLLGALKIFE